VPTLGDELLPDFPVDRVWGVYAVAYIMRVTGHHRDAALASLRIEVEAGNVRLYPRMSGDPLDMSRENLEGQRLRSFLNRSQFEHVFVDRADLKKRWPEPDTSGQELRSEDPAPSPARDEKPLPFKKATYPQIIEHARIALASVSTWKDKDKDKDLNPLVRQQLNAAGLDAGRDRIRDPIDEVLKERQQNS